MKKIKKFIIADFIILLIKVLGGFLTHSYTMITSGIYDLLLIVSLLLVGKKSENKKYKSIISSFISLIFIILSIGMIFISFTFKLNKPSFFIILFVIIPLLIRYAVNCFTTNVTYSKKKGLLTIAQISSNLDFYNYGVILGSLILCKLQFLLSFLKYGDRLGTVLIAAVIIYKCLKIIINSFNYAEDKELNNNEEIKKELLTRTEVKKVESIENNNFGGFKSITVNTELKEGLSPMDLNTFIVTLQDYLLKYANAANVNMTNGIVKKKVKVRSKKQDARNSGSRNSKTNSKNKNTKKKNKKR